MTVHIVGGGIAGLSAAVACTQQGQHVVVYEAAPGFGGRCRSYRIDQFDTTLDNGAHAILGANSAIQGYLHTIGAACKLACYDQGLEFVDLRSKANWRLRTPQALWSSDSRPPGVSAAALVGSAVKCCFGQPITDLAAREKLWEPLCTSALNTPLAEADYRTLRPVLRQMAGWRGLREGLYLPSQTLAATYIDPAIEWLTRQGAGLHAGRLVRSVEVSEDNVTGLLLDHTQVQLKPSDSLILAVPPWSDLLNQIGIAADGLAPSPIVNAHFQVPEQSSARFVGMVGGISQWAWLRGQLMTVTISAADNLVEMAAKELAALVWAEVAFLVGAPTAAMPIYHAVKERRATLRHSRKTNECRPTPLTRWPNVILAGDWTDTGLPCTLEGAALSGQRAAKILAAVPAR